jgi:hypothetical protein
MGALLSLVVAAGALGVSSPREGYAYPPQQHGAISATLVVRVGEKPVAPGQGRATLLIVVEGPAQLEVGPAHLEDAIEAWTVPARFSSWSLMGERVTWAVSLDLVQSKAGPAALPSLRLRCREGPGAEWHELRWVDILKEPRPPPPPEELPPLPPSPWPGRLRWAGIVVAAGLMLFALTRVGRRWLRGQPAPVPAHARAARELARLEVALPDTGARGELHTNLANVLRTYLAERFDLDTLRRTTGELMDALAPSSVLSAEQTATLRSLLESCDLAKFAGASPPVEECREALQRARAFVEETAVVRAKDRVGAGGDGHHDRPSIQSTT